MPGTVKLQSSDGKLFEIDHETGMQMETVRDIYDSIGDDDTVLPLPKVRSKTLLPILQWCEYHKNDDYLKNVTLFCPTTSNEPPKSLFDIDVPFDKEFINVPETTWDVLSKGLLDINDPFDKEFINVPESQLLDYMVAANFLAIDHLENLIAKAISDKLRNKTAKEIREQFGLKNDKRTSAMEVYQRMNPDDRPRTSFTAAEERKGTMVEGELTPPPKKFKI